MAHILTTYDAEGRELSAVKTNDRQRAFDLYDAVAKSLTEPGSKVTLTGDGVAKEHVVPEADFLPMSADDLMRAELEYRNEARAKAKAASGGAGERAGGAPDDAGHAPADPQAAPPPAKQPDQSKPKSGKAKSGVLTSH